MRMSCIPAPFLSFPGYQMLWVWFSPSLALEAPSSWVSSPHLVTFCAAKTQFQLYLTHSCSGYQYMYLGTENPERDYYICSLLVSVSYFQENFVWEIYPHPISSWCSKSFWETCFAECRVPWSRNISCCATYVMCPLSVPKDGGYTQGWSFPTSPALAP